MPRTVDWCCGGIGGITLARGDLPAGIERLIRDRVDVTDDAASEVAAMLREVADRLAGGLRDYLGGGTLDDARAYLYGAQLSDVIAILDDITDDNGYPLMDAAQEKWRDELQRLSGEAMRTAERAGLALLDPGFDSAGFEAAMASRYRNAADTWGVVVKEPFALRILQSFDAALFADSWSSASTSLRASLESAIAPIETDVRTETAAFDRYASATTARFADPDGSLLAWVYAGPVDGLQRRFCREVYGLAWTRDQVVAMDNGMPGMPPVFFGGGYNCRHHWVQMPMSAANALGIPRATDADAARVGV